MTTIKPRMIIPPNILDRDKELEFKLKFIIFYVWYASVKNLKAIVRYSTDVHRYIIGLPVWILLFIENQINF